MGLYSVALAYKYIVWYEIRNMVSGNSWLFDFSPECVVLADL
jgi:hypothetical protein